MRRSIYTDAVPPFQVASDAALRCIETWARLRKCKFHDLTFHATISSPP